MAKLTALLITYTVSASTMAQPSGDLKPVTGVDEPSALLLFGFATAAIAGYRWITNWVSKKK